MKMVSLSALRTGRLYPSGNIPVTHFCWRHAVAQLVVALRYKPVGRGFDSGWCNWNFSLHNPSGRIVALGLTQPLTEMSTSNTSWG